MVSKAEILAFIKEETLSEAKPESDIEIELGVSGDDFFELMEAFAKKYEVDMSDFLWYFHSCEEGTFSIGGLFFKSPDRRVKRIPVTPAMLTDFANSKKWKIEYPAHSIPPKRIDLMINVAFTIVFAVLMSWLMFQKYC